MVSIELLISSYYEIVFNVIEEHGSLVTLLPIILNTYLQACFLQLLLDLFHPLSDLPSHTGLTQGCNSVKIIVLQSLCEVFE